MSDPNDSTFDGPKLTEGAIDYAGALKVQVGGGHYKGFAIQPIEFIQANGFDFITGNIIKYASRHKAKNGAEDVKKIIHYCELLLELEYAGK